MNKFINLIIYLRVPDKYENFKSFKNILYILKNTRKDKYNINLIKIITTYMVKVSADVEPLAPFAPLFSGLSRATLARCILYSRFGDDGAHCNRGGTVHI
jgi:hypothetical protein